jgi:acyl carrier protein
MAGSGVDCRRRNWAGNRHQANWQGSANVLGGRRSPILDPVLPSALAATPGDSELLRQLHEVPEAQRGNFLTEYLRHEVQQFLRLAQPPAPTTRFLELGTDSLMAVELRNRLYGQFGGAFTISATAVFDYPTIRSLAEYLAGQVPELLDVEPVGASEPTR